jgi:RNA ligase
MIFPKIERIEDVLPHIEGMTEFVVAEREGFTVINYMVAFDTTFPDLPDLNAPIRDIGEYETRCKEYMHAAMLRECRGLMFDRDGNLISRPYAKFFNVNERAETQANLFDLSGDDWVALEKLDGSFIRPVRIDGLIRLCTKMGITEQSHQAEEFLEGLDEELHDRYFNFFETYVDDYTPIFEFCSRKNQVVIDYPEDQLVLTGMRLNKTGEYVRYKYLSSVARAFRIPCVEPLPLHCEDETMPAVVEEVRQWLGCEGIVLCFDDGRKVKVKALDYCEKHGAKDALLLEKNLLRFYLEEKLDDYLPLLDDQFRARVDEYIGKVSEGINESVEGIQRSVDGVYVNCGLSDRAAQAKYIIANYDPLVRPLLFSALDGKDIRKTIIAKIASATTTSTKLDEVRPLFNAQWV